VDESYAGGGGGNFGEGESLVWRGCCLKHCRKSGGCC
jgi:hypothetical protein